MEITSEERMRLGKKIAEFVGISADKIAEFIINSIEVRIKRESKRIQIESKKRSARE